MLDALLAQTQTLLLIDNGSKKNPQAIVRAANASGQGQAALINLEQNAGLGRAYNIGITHAREMKAHSVLLLDQDSIPEPDMIHILRKSHNILIKKNRKVAAIGVRYKTGASAEYSQFVRIAPFSITKIDCSNNNPLVQTDFIISSGSLISIQALDSIGNMDETLFIDHVDTEWCLRAKSKGFEIYGCCHAKMRHALGNTQNRIWWGRWRTIAYHPPFRYYYIVRNSILLWQRSYIHAGWKRADKLRILYIIIFFCLFSPNRIKNLTMMISGLADGLKGKTGKRTTSSA